MSDDVQEEKITNFLDFQIRREVESEAFDKQTGTEVKEQQPSTQAGSNNQIKYVNQIRSDVNVRKEGSVLKLAGFLVKSWEDRWFKLRGQHLLYFKNQADSHNQPRQTLELRGAKILRAAEGKISAPTEFCIEIQMPNSQKSYYFCTKNEQDLNEWTAALEEAVRLEFKDFVTLKSHEDRITEMIFSPNGKKLITGSIGGSLKVWDLQFYKLLTSLEGHKAKVTSCSYSHELVPTFASVSLDNTLKIWDGNNYQLLTAIQGFQDGVTHCIITSGRILTATKAGSLKMWSTSTLQLLGTLKGHKGAFAGICLSVDGKKLVTASKDCTISFWTLPNYRATATFNHTKKFQRVTISHSAEAVVASDEEFTIYVWKWGAFNKPMLELKQHTAKITSLTLAGPKLFSASLDKTIRVWDLLTGQPIKTIELEGEVRGCISSFDNKLVIAWESNKIHVWDSVSLTEIATLVHSHNVINVRINPQITNLICALEDNSIKVWAF